MLEKQIKKIIAQLADHEARIGSIENIKSKKLSKKGLVTETQKQSKRKVAREDLFPPIQKLLKDGFFKDWRTDLEVYDTLTLKLLTKKKPLRASVVNVLRAMIKKELLTRDKVQKGKRSILVYKQDT